MLVSDNYIIYFKAKNLEFNQQKWKVLKSFHNLNYKNINYNYIYIYVGKKNNFAIKRNRKEKIIFFHTRVVRLFIFSFFQKFEFTNFKFINLFASFEIKISNFEI